MATRQRPMTTRGAYYLHAMHAALIRSVVEFRDYATDAERAELISLQERWETGFRDDDRDYTALFELDVLTRAVSARREVSQARAEGDEDAARSLEDEHRVWSRRMAATREALVVAGLERSTVCVEAASVLISVRASSFDEISVAASTFTRIVRKRLGCLKANFVWAMQYPWIPQGRTGDGVRSRKTCSK
jgi:hypothetical protein